MRSFSWLLIWLMVLKMSLGSVMAMPNPWPGTEATVHEVADTTYREVQLATLPDCHGHAISQDDGKGLKTSSSSKDTDAPPGNTCDCHHCCAVGLGRGSRIEQAPAPATHPTNPPQGWQSVNLRPVLRPPIT